MTGSGKARGQITRFSFFAPRSMGAYLRRFFREAPLLGRMFTAAYFALFFISPLFGLDDIEDLQILIRGTGIGGFNVALIMAALSVYHFNAKLPVEERGPGIMVFLLMLSPLLLGFMAGIYGVLIGDSNTFINIALSLYITIPFVLVYITAFDAVIRFTASREQSQMLVLISVLSLLISIYTFAAIFFLNNLLINIDGLAVSFGDAFYYSGITFTTTGYGDILPIGIGKYLAVMEALVGIVTMSLFTAVFIRILSSSMEGDGPQ